MSERDHRSILDLIAKELNFEINRHRPLAGGDINEVFLIESNSEHFVIKLNDASRFPGMFDAEKAGLDILRNSGTIDIPKPLKSGIVQEKSYLLLEYMQPGKKSAKFWEYFGEQMAGLHQQTSALFGLDHDNYIGSLHQLNDNRESAAEFYIEMRLEPQLKLAQDRGYKLKIPEHFFTNCANTIPDEPPSLIHGDLWNGNYIVNSEGMPCLIDPAIAYAPREMDIGMMHLFGGFDKILFDTYNEIYPLKSGWKERLDLWQLYYLLVHLNLFGSGYLSRCTSILKKYG